MFTAVKAALFSSPAPTSVSRPSTMADQQPEIAPQTEQDGTISTIFNEVWFSVIRSPDLLEAEAEQLIAQLVSNGAVHVPTNPTTGRVELDAKVTHIISATADFPDYHAATDAFVAVVKPEWVAVSLAKKKTAQLRQYSPDPRLFFSGVVVACADIPSGDKEAIAGGVLAMGGQYSPGLSKLVTHIVALTDDNLKCQEALKRKYPCKIVLPHWFDHCLKLGKRIDEAPYTLPNPEITRMTADDPVATPSDSHLVGASSPRPGTLPTPDGSQGDSERDLSVFTGKKVMLSEDLDLGDRLRGTIEDLISTGGGAITATVHKADMFICQYRGGKRYRIASQMGKDVGNLPWLYYLIAHNVWTSPLRRLLHYPIVAGGLPGFQGYRISVSNYQGEARLYLESLIRAAGGEFTKTMTHENTHLIAARAHSEKYAAAKEWNIHVINHLWLEESYAKWEIQSLTNERYTTFPARTNLGEIIGQTEIDREALKPLIDPQPGDDDSINGDEPSDTAEQHHSDLSSSTTLPSGKKISNGSRTRKSGENIVPKTPRQSGASFIGKENEIPSSTGGRSAKDRAMAKIHDLAPDIALYEKEKKRVGGVVWGGKRSPDEYTTPRKRTASPESEDEENEAGESGGREAKRRRRSRPPVVMKLLLTSYKSWVGQPRKEEDEKHKLRDLGIQIVSEPSQCTHLAAPSIIRTQKFVSALAYAPIVISTSFIDECLAREELAMPVDFLLKDPQSEKRVGFRLQESLERAKTNKRELLKGVVVYCTPGVQGGYETYKAIIEANGGQCSLFQKTSRRQAWVPTKVALDAQGKKVDVEESKTQPMVYMLSSPSAEDQKLWGWFGEMVVEHGMEPRIVKTDWLLSLAMAQEPRWDDDYELVAGQES